MFIVSLPLECKLHRGMDFCQFCALANSQCLKQHSIHSRQAITLKWNERKWMNPFSLGLSPEGGLRTLLAREATSALPSPCPFHVPPRFTIGRREVRREEQKLFVLSRCLMLCYGSSQPSPPVLWLSFSKSYGYVLWASISLDTNYSLGLFFNCGLPVFSSL